MKKLRKISISLLLVLATLLSFASCDDINISFSSNKNAHREGYTGGFLQEDHWYSYTEIHWVETFEEAMLAIEHLEAAGNKLKGEIISSYDNEVVDAKYCFILETYGSKRLPRGKEWYDREELRSVSYFYVGFLDKVTIEEIEYSYYEFRRYIRVYARCEKEEFPHSDNITYMCSECQDLSLKKDKKICDAVAKGTSDLVAEIGYAKIENHTEELPDNFHEEFVKTLVYVGG